MVSGISDCISSDNHIGIKARLGGGGDMILLTLFFGMFFSIVGLIYYNIIILILGVGLYVISHIYRINQSKVYDVRNKRISVH